MDFTVVKSAFDAIASWSTTNALAAFAAAGALTAAFLDLLKNLTPVRRWFQQWWLGEWLEQRLNSFNRDVGGRLDPAGNPEPMLIALATGGERAAFYDLPAEQLVAQMNAAAQITLEYPVVYYNLLAVLSQGAAIDDLNRVVDVPSARQAAAAGAAPPATYTDARNRVSHRLQRNLDGLQIAMSDRWKFSLQLAAVFISTALIELAVWQTQQRLSWLALVVGLVAGYFAPVTRDLIAALQKLRQ